MKRVFTITFNHAHNFGSMLQTYALQEFIKELGAENNCYIDYHVIDFYSNQQKELYSIIKKNNNIKDIIKSIINIIHYKKLKIKHKKFENFLSENIFLTKRYNSTNELLTDPPKGDYFISGSDQIWNVRASDFNDVYYLNFVTSGKRLSYAASLGPLEIDWRKYPKDKYIGYLQKFDSISVREKGSADNLKSLINFTPEIHVDPTLLISAKEWRKLKSNANYNNGKYILLYCLEPTKNQIKLTKKISQRLKLPVLILRYNNKNDFFNFFVKRYDSGPKDFLAFIDNASLILTSSFHGTVFSLIFKKPFYVINETEDFRIFDILKKVKLSHHIVQTEKDTENIELEFQSSKELDEFMNNSIDKSKEYLKHSLGLI